MFSTSAQTQVLDTPACADHTQAQARLVRGALVAGQLHRAAAISCGDGSLRLSQTVRRDGQVVDIHVRVVDNAPVAMVIEDTDGRFSDWDTETQYDPTGMGLLARQVYAAFAA